MKLSYRDRIILIVVVVIVVLFAGVFVAIKPAFTELKTNQTMLTEKKAEKIKVEEKIASAKDLDKKVKAAYDESKGLSEFFLPVMDTYETDQFLSPICDANRLALSTLDMVEPTPAPVEFYMYQKKGIVYPLCVAADLNGEDPVITPEQMQGGTLESFGEQAALTQATISVKGKAEDIHAFLDAVEKLEKSVVVSTFSETKESKEEGAAADETNTATITLDFYSLRELSEPKL